MGERRTKNFVWNKKDFIGAGYFSKVYLCSRREETEKQFAVKVCKWSKYYRGHNSNDFNRRPYIEDIELLKTFNSQNIIKYFATEKVECPIPKVAIIMELADGSLRGELQKEENSIGLPKETVCVLMDNCVSGLEYLDDHKLSHRDIRPENILVSHEPKLTFKFCDFGLSRLLEQRNDQMSSIVGTLAYMPSCMIRRSEDEEHPGYTKDEYDIWATTCCFFEAATGRRPFQIRQKENVNAGVEMKKILENRRNDSAWGQFDEKKGKYVYWANLPEQHSSYTWESQAFLSSYYQMMFSKAKKFVNIENFSKLTRSLVEILEATRCDTKSRMFFQEQAEQRRRAEQVDIQRAALGREARVGDMYDASTDTFCKGFSLFPQEVPKSLVTFELCRQVKCEISMTDSRAGRCKEFGLTPEEQLSVLGLDIPLSGCAEYLTSEICGEGEQTVSLLHRNRLFALKLNIYADEVRRRSDILLERAVRAGATHMVYKVEWGLNSVIALSFQSEDEQNVIEASKNLALRILKAVSGGVGTERSTRLSSDVPDYANKAKLEFYTDATLGQQVVRTLEECGTFVRNIGRSLNENTAEFKQVVYTLIPLNLLKKPTSQTTDVPQCLIPHDESTLDAILQLLQKIQNVETTLRNLQRRLQDKQHFFNETTIWSVIAARQNIGGKIRNLKKKIAENIKLYRLTKRSIADVRMTLQSAQTLFSEINVFFAKFMSAKEKLEYLEKCEALEAQIVSDMETLEKLLSDGEHFAFFTDLSHMDEAFSQNSKIFEILCSKYRGKCILFCSDMDHSSRLGVHCIVYCVRGCIIEEDVCRLAILLEDHNVVKADTVVSENVKMPNSFARLQAACPKSLCPSECSGKKREWICYHCERVVEYGFNNYVYCECGEIDPFSMKWYCTDPSHGFQPVRFDVSTLENELDALQQAKEYNVLLLGETGAGKSTWINAMNNYAMYDSLATAQHHPLNCLIPSSFTIETNTFQEKLVKVGESDNENFMEGQSATQDPQTYTFIFKNELIRLIDVPGVCDTRGPGQDKRNFDKILRALQTISELHAICILLTPDATKLTVSFLYCINELLTHIDKSAAKNIVFCFTKTRATFYRAGQTLPILRNYLTEFEKRRQVKIPLQQDTMYFFDNEAFRLLCAIQDGVEFTEDEKKAYEESWSRSANETVRFLNNVLQRKPYLTRQMLTLNEARRIAASLTEPLAKITENINTNLRLLDDQRRAVEMLKSDVLGLEKELRIKQITLKAKNIDHPRTVCAGPNCCQAVTLPQTGEKVNYYKQVCHRKCGLKNIVPGQFPDCKLKKCDAMDNGGSETCLRCRCHWELHLHIVAEQTHEEIEVVDPTTLALLKEKQSYKIEKEDVLAAYDRKRAELEGRHKRITEICASFGAFLDRNSLLPYNDSMIQYLDYSIKLAELDAAESQDRTKLDSLQSFRKRYVQELNILKSNLAIRPGEITLVDVMRMKEELYSMNSDDCNICEYLKELEKANDKHYRREDQYFDVRQWGTKREQQRKLPKAKRTTDVTPNLFTLSQGSNKFQLQEPRPHTPEQFQSQSQETASTNKRSGGLWGYLGF